MFLINGHPGDCLDPRDRGLHYGDGLFETMAAVDGRIPLWERHLARLREGCRRLGIQVPCGETLQREAGRLIPGQGRAVIKMIVTRGAGGRGYRPPSDTEATRILSRHPWPEFPVANFRQGITVRLCESRLGTNPSLAGIKHLNRLEQILARSEWEDAAIAEGLMLDQQGHLVEGTMSNLFLVEEGRLVTPPVTHCGVSGIMRGLLLDLAGEAGIPLSVEEVGPPRLRAAGECFVCNSLIGIWPIRRLGEWQWPLGDTTLRMQERLSQELGYLP
jgi:4-amino-4-deoxychorismate lyase